MGEGSRCSLYKFRPLILTLPEILPTVSGEFIADKRPTLSGESAVSDVQALRQVAARFPLPWSHYIRLLALRSEEARKFYETEALHRGWTVRQLDRQISTQFYERTALSRNKAAMLAKSAKIQAGDAVSPDEEIKDPFVLEFLGLKDEYSESDLEDALIRHWKGFSSNWRATSLLSPASDACESVTNGIASTCFFFTASCAALWSSTKSSAGSLTRMQGRCISTLTTLASIGLTRLRTRRSGSSYARKRMMPSLATS